MEASARLTARPIGGWYADAMRDRTPPGARRMRSCFLAIYFKNSGAETAERHCQLKLRMCGAPPSELSMATRLSAVARSAASVRPP